MALLLKEIEITAIQNEFQSKVKERVDKNQKEYILREQMKLIREELGEDNTESDADEYQKALDALDADQEVKNRIKKEIDRFKSISANSSESAVTRGYIETLLELPWNKASEDNKDLANAEQILEDRVVSVDLKKITIGQLCGAQSDEQGRKPDHLSGGTAGNRQDKHCALCGACAG